MKNKLCKTYIKKIKSLFPIMGKSERNYIKTIKINVDDFLADSPNSSIEDIYKEFGNPGDVITSYYETIDTNNIIKRISIFKYIKLLIIVLIVCSLSLTIFYIKVKYDQHKVFMEEQIFSEETIIE